MSITLAFATHATKRSNAAAKILPTWVCIGLIAGLSLVLWVMLGYLVMQIVAQF